MSAPGGIPVRYAAGRPECGSGGALPAAAGGRGRYRRVTTLCIPMTAWGIPDFASATKQSMT